VIETNTFALSELHSAHLQLLQNRLEQHLGATRYDSLLLHSGVAPTLFRDDQNYPFHACAPFRHWVPLTNVENCFLHLVPGRRPTLLFHQPADFWHQAAAVPNNWWSDAFDIVATPDLESARRALPGDLSRTAYIGEDFMGLPTWDVAAINPAPLLTRLDFDRAWKSPYELHCLRAASRLGVRGHRAAHKAWREGCSEFGIQLAYLEACRMRESELPYNSIIAANEHSAVLHYQLLDRKSPAERRSFLIDAGADYAGYASDITRSYASEDNDFAALIAGMEEVQQSLCSSVRSGVDWRDVHLSAHQHVAELLHDSGIIRCDAAEALDTGVSSVFLPHGVGHLLGLQVHDVGGRLADAEGHEIPPPQGHPSLRLTRILEEGFVVTMEPGLYFIDQLLEQARGDARGRHIDWARVDSLRPYGGIRIEDDLAVTRSGCENLTRDAFSEV